jgi:tungstate transport system ATP-binding protein
MESGQTIYHLENITQSYDGRTVLTIPDLLFERGQSCALVGPNGSGKTTLLRLLAFIDKPASGRIVFSSVPLWNGSGRHIDLARRVTMVSNPPYLFNRSVSYNIAYGMRIRGSGRDEIRHKIQQVLELAGLSGFEKRDARKLSTGEQQRVALARALALEPEVLLLDEPTASIDRKHAQEIESLLHKISSQEGMTVIFSTHNHQQAGSLAQRVISLYEGRVESFAYENFFFGICEAGAIPRIQLNSDIFIRFMGASSGPVYISIDPKDVIVSRTDSHSPQVNCFRGKLTKMAMRGSHVKLTVDVGVPLESSITGDTLRLLNPQLGEDLYCIFDARSVRIIENGKKA